MYGDIEDLVLSGRIFNPPSRSSSPVRSRSPSPGPAPWPTEDGDFEYDSDAERRATIEAHVASQQQQESIGMGPGRTGVKGVIRDRAEAEGLARAKRADETTALNRAMEKASLGGKTWGEEEKERLAELARQEARSGAGAFKAATKGRFGHLREVGVRSYVQAVEEDRNVWVAVHIYDSSLERCAALDEVLSRLARSYPFTKFLRARAGAIGFASSAPAISNLASQSGFNLSRFPKRGLTVSSRSRIDEKDEFFDDEVDDDGEDEADEVDEDRWEDDEVDTDVLPTLLVYRGGELVHSWVRVDWEAKQGVEELLKRNNILTSPRHYSGATGILEVDDEDELFDDGEELVFGTSDDER